MNFYQSVHAIVAIYVDDLNLVGTLEELTKIANSDFYFLRKTHGQIRLFSNPSFNRYSLSRLYHMRPDCFKPYKDLYNLIEYTLQDFKLYAPGILNPSGIFKYMLQGFSSIYHYPMIHIDMCISKFL